MSTTPTQVGVLVEAAPSNESRGSGSGASPEERVARFKSSLSSFAAALDKTRAAIRTASREAEKTLTVSFERITDAVPRAQDDASRGTERDSTTPRTLERLDVE
ncbi:hypothetical protein LZ198_24555 [Myxococcus sp. K15C18031901]|uniref:hypothetical protein n=1 Tax=Myxococcus dinghuensis TaxID=2906761 RepID=UPI0020A7117C|nr:hypothetical protein [Myxococcus dinghuensis]MCP3102043.1 hypothetical protein [Myxococcus dinghuensis]